MKNSIYLFVVLLIVCGCNKDDSSDGNSAPNSALLVKNIHTDYGNGGGSDEIFHYRDNKLKAIEYGCYDTVVYFEYNANNKVSDSYRFFDENFNLDTFNLQDVEVHYHNEYVYENNRLVRTNGVEFSYTNGLIKNIVINGYPNNKNIIISYEDNTISSIFVAESNGESRVHTFLFDDKINPMHQLFLQFGIIGSDGCNSYNNYMFFEDIPIFKNNIIAEFVDNIPEEPASYVYFDSGVPEAISYDGYNGPYTHFFSY